MSASGWQKTAAVTPWNSGIHGSAAKLLPLRASGKASSDAGIPVAACCLNQAWTIRMNFPWKTVKANVERSIAIGKEFGCKTFIGLSGDLEGSFEDTQKLVLLENLKRTAEDRGKRGRYDRP